MTYEQKAHIAGNVFPIMAEIAGKSFSTPAMLAMTEALDDLDYDAVIKTLSEWPDTLTGL